MYPLIITDPRAIPQSEFDISPFFVSKGGGSDPFSRIIRWRTRSWCEHSMLAINPGKFVWESTSNWYGEGPMEHYMTPGACLRFYQLVNANPQAIAALRNYVYGRIKAPWYSKMYDWIGVVGQAIGLPKIHTPGLEYCSVDNVHALKSMENVLPAYDEAVINRIPDQESPGYFDSFMLSYPLVFRHYGTYQHP